MTDNEKKEWIEARVGEKCYMGTTFTILGWMTGPTIPSYPVHVKREYDGREMIAKFKNVYHDGKLSAS